MDFSLSDEQSLLRDAMGGYLRQHYPFARRDAIARSASGWDGAVWRGLADDLGLLALASGDGAGGLDPVAVMVVMEQAGDALLIEPLLENVVIAGGLLRRSGGAAAAGALRGIAAGDTALAFAWAEPTARYRPRDVTTRARPDGDSWIVSGAKSLVVAAPWASALIVTARTEGQDADGQGISLFLIPVDTAGVGLSAYRTVDGRRAADVTLAEVQLPGSALLGAPGAALPLIERVIDEAIAAQCAEALGAMRRLHRFTVDYLRDRRQFDRALFDFQSLQHRLVDMAARIELATSATFLATMRLDAAPVARARAVSAAKAVVDEAARFVGENAVQLHGGMGMTDDLPVGHYFKRLLAIGQEFGTRDHHLARYARLPA